jgi:multidrug efflux system outer membrane protein
VNTRPLAVPQAVPAGLPSELLQRRPDLQQAEAAMRAAFAAYDVTRKSAWPTLALTGSFGAQSADLTDLLRRGARIWSIGPSLLVSLFDAGRHEARTGQARTQAEQAAVGWQRATQTAFREVADALVAVDQLAAQEAEVERQRRAAQDALRLATRRYEAGYSAYLEVLDAQRGTQDAELGLLRVRQARLEASVALMKALGGGWTAPPQATARR